MESPKPAKFAGPAPIPEYCSDMLMFVNLDGDGRDENPASSGRIKSNMLSPGTGINVSSCNVPAWINNYPGLCFGSELS